MSYPFGKFPLCTPPGIAGVLPAAESAPLSAPHDFPRARTMFCFHSTATLIGKTAASPVMSDAGAPLPAFPSAAVGSSPASPPPAVPLRLGRGTTQSFQTNISSRQSALCPPLLSRFPPWLPLSVSPNFQSAAATPSRPWISVASFPPFALHFRFWPCPWLSSY